MRTMGHLEVERVEQAAGLSLHDDSYLHFLRFVLGLVGWFGEGFPLRRWLR